MNEFWNETTSAASVRIAVVGVLAILALFLLVETLNAAENYGRPDHAPTNTITVTGHGTATAVPDTATVSFGATETSAQVADAQAKVTAKIDAALASVKQQGVDAKDITTTSYNINPHYVYTTCAPGMACPSNATVSGYDVSEMISVKVRDTTKVAAILQGLGQANVTNISGPDFTVDDPASVEAEARGKAIDQARAQAQVLSKQLGARLGQVVSFSENGNTPRPMYAMDASLKAEGATMAAAPSVPVGQNEYASDVSITYEIR